jgi:transcription elongation factor GreA
VRVSTSSDPDAPVPLTTIGVRYLEAQLRDHLDQQRRIEHRTGEDQTDVQDSGDASVRIEERDDQSQLDDRIARLRQTLADAVPVEPGPDDGVVRLGSTVRVRTDAGESETYRVVHRAELGATPDDVSVDAPVGRALSGRAVGDRVQVETPEGGRRLVIEAVTPYRPERA